MSAVRISELIRRLQEIRQECGDLEVAWNARSVVDLEWEQWVPDVQVVIREAPVRGRHLSVVDIAQGLYRLKGLES